MHAAMAPGPASKVLGVYTLVHAGRCTAQKNQLLLLEALSTMRDSPVELWILGRGPLAPRLREHVMRLGLSSRVRWLGFQHNPFAFFRSADCFVLTSDHEGMPNVVIEALLCGTPVVSTRCPYGPEELIDDGETGLLTPPRDVGGLADALRALADEATRRRMSAAAPIRIAREFALEHVYPQYEATLRHGAI
jgi:glycosyltransferase involved in cell wall biosynthesis